MAFHFCLAEIGYPLSANILVLAYNRPEHLKRLLLSLSLNPEASSSSVTISIDGAKSDSDKIYVEECVIVAKLEYGFGKVEVIKNQENRGLEVSVISAITRAFEKSEKVIVLEDDLVVSNSFLKFMNLGLEKYEESDDVASIQGYQYPGIKLAGPVFLRGADCWGWATWRNRWSDTEFDSKILLERFTTPELISEFNFNGNKKNLEMLKDQAEGRVNSWAIRWHASQFLQNRLSLFPEVSLVQNLGSDGSGVNSGRNNLFRTQVSNLDEFYFPEIIQESLEFRGQLSNFFYKIYVRGGRFKIRLMLRGFRKLSVRQ
jgi:hypothetical protein